MCLPWKAFRDKVLLEPRSASPVLSGRLSSRGDLASTGSGPSPEPTRASRPSASPSASPVFTPERRVLYASRGASGEGEPVSAVFKALKGFAPERQQKLLRRLEEARG